MDNQPGAEPDTGQDTGPGDDAPLSAVEAAQRANMHERTIRRAIARGKLRATKEHGAFRISPADLRAWQADQEPEASPDTGPDQTADSPPGVSAAPDLSPVVDELRRLLDVERKRADDTIARKDQKIEELTGEMGYWRGQADVYRSQIAALSAGGNDHQAEDTDVLAADFAENGTVDPPEAPQRELPDEGLDTPEHHPSWLLAAWQKLTGRS